MESSTPAGARPRAVNSPTPFWQRAASHSPSRARERPRSFPSQQATAGGRVAPFTGYTPTRRQAAISSRDSRPNHSSNSPTPASAVRTPWLTSTNHSELKLFVKNFPPGCDTVYIFRHLEKFGNIIRIDIQEPRKGDRTDVFVNFKPVPKETSWIQRGIQIDDDGRLRLVNFEQRPSPEPFWHPSPMHPNRKFADQTTAAISEIGFGIMQSEASMLEFTTIRSTPAMAVQVLLNLQQKALDIDFPVIFSPTTGYALGDQRAYLFKLRITLPQIKTVTKMYNDSTSEIALIVTINMPPLLFRKTDKVAGTHEQGATYWTDWQTWYRQTSIDRDQESSRNATIQLQKQDTVIDTGRWLTYKLVFSASTSATKDFREICDCLIHHNIAIQEQRAISIEPSRSEHLWSWLENPKAVSEDTSQSSALHELHEMAIHTIHLPFETRYQLEACISNGILHECNINDDFLTRLKNLEPERAVKLLEKVADEKERIFNPNEVFPRLLHKSSTVRKRVPRYCATIRSATVTPTTVYFTAAAVETSNSIIRRYQHLEDRFLRVKFTDEKYKGKVMSNEDSTMNEVYTRIKRTMTNGINVGGRQYEFLAFSNSQFREGGAYFFAPTTSLTTQDIRNSMGDFSRVERIVAKYCARIGQAFSTTRALRLNVKIEIIPDIWAEDGRYCFTDGVGKISPFLAQMIAQEYGLPCSANDYPSVFQVRIGGCKGILVVDPTLTKNVIQIRDSQRKFEIPNQPLGLDICRISQLSASNLNMQLILVLSALGIDDEVFLEKMDQMLAELQQAMTSEHKALELLQRNIDFNQMTIQLAQMIFDGFMEARDPFMMSCLRLWRAWNIKYLKEKARIYVEQGAFVLGCVDETATLRGHFDNMQPKEPGIKDESSLPEIFLQIEQPPSSGKLTVITGVCIVARNPSLHAGDVRVVRAVDKQQLHHYRNCVVFPQTGDRDLPNMCSGGDLDGDDYLVIWDKDLLPEEWNYPAMNFTGAKAKESDGPVTVHDMTSFFVTFMKYNNLSRIAVAHRYWADACPDGVKDPKCLELATLHSMAVDYMKNGVPAQMGKHLRVRQWPHWAEAKKKPQWKIYRSRKVLGKLYDKVQRVDMQPQWDCEFDERILTAYEIDESILGLARKAKREYDAAVLRIMAKYAIETEFEVWTTFVMKHSSEFGDYKFAETIGEETCVLKDHHQQICFEYAGTDKKDEKYWSKMEPFFVAMYTVTAQELAAALAECNQVKLVRGQQVPVREKRAATMPFISFPWLFPHELGLIAKKNAGPNENLVGRQEPVMTVQRKPKEPEHDLLGGDFVQEPLPEVSLPDHTQLNGESLHLPLERKTDDSTKLTGDRSQDLDIGTEPAPTSSSNDVVPNTDQVDLPATSTTPGCLGELAQPPVATTFQQQNATYPLPPNPTEDQAPTGIKERMQEEYEKMNHANEVRLEIKLSPLDDLEKLMGL